MPAPGRNRSRFIVGLALIAAAILLFVFARGDFSTPGAIAVFILGLVSIVVSRRG